MADETDTLQTPEDAGAGPGDDERFFDWNGRPVYRDDKGFMVVVPGGEEKPLAGEGELWKFMHEAVAIDEAAFKKMKADAAKPAPAKKGSKE